MRINRGMLVLLMGLSFWLALVSGVQAASVESKENRRVMRKIDTLNGTLTLLDKTQIARSVRKCGLDENLVLAIIKTESDFVNGAVNRRSKDFGLMQVNEYHIKISRLDRVRLTWDVDYNVMHGCRILGWFLSTYPKRSEAIGRYNCGTRVQCVRLRQVKRYVRRVQYHYKKLKSVSYHMDKGLRLKIKKVLRTRSH